LASAGEIILSMLIRTLLSPTELNPMSLTRSRGVR